MSTLTGNSTHEFGARLDAERERLGLSQTALAALAGTTKRTVFSWEKGKTAPDAFQLMQLRSAGMDVVYILTGQRGGDLLRPDESALLDNYRHSNSEGQRLLRDTSAVFAQPAGGKRKRA